MSAINLIIMLIQAVIMLFQLRALMQSSSVDYYNKVTQVVIKLTQPIIGILPIRSKQIKGFYYCGFVVSFVIALIASGLLHFIFKAPIPLALLISVILTVKTFGYLILILLLAQALTSWLPSTRGWSLYFSQITHPIVSPVQRIIPPIGMVDISLMIVMLAIFAINSLCYKVFGIWWGIC